MPTRLLRRSVYAAAFASLLLAFAAPAHKSRNVIFVMTDGLRWQEVFRGADPAVLDKEHGGVSDVSALRHLYWRDTPEERGEALMPFLWRDMAKAGQIFGNRELASDASVTNQFNLSSPRYSETLAGFADRACSRTTRCRTRTPRCSTG